MRGRRGGFVVALARVPLDALIVRFCLLVVPFQRICNKPQNVNILYTAQGNHGQLTKHALTRMTPAIHVCLTSRLLYVYFYMDNYVVLIENNDGQYTD